MHCDGGVYGKKCNGGKKNWIKLATLLKLLLLSALLAIIIYHYYYY